MQHQDIKWKRILLEEYYPSAICESRLKVFCTSLGAAERAAADAAADQAVSWMCTTQARRSMASHAEAGVQISCSSFMATSGFPTARHDRITYRTDGMVNSAQDHYTVFREAAQRQTYP